MLCIYVFYVFIVNCHFITIPAYCTVPCVCKCVADSHYDSYPLVFLSVPRREVSRFVSLP